MYVIPGIGPLVFSSGGRFAWGLGEAGISGKELPLIDRYFPGGINTVRGYEIRSLGPRESTFNPQGVEINNQPIGGTNQLIVQSEFIFPLFQEVGLRGVAFFDRYFGATGYGGIECGQWGSDVKRNIVMSCYNRQVESAYFICCWLTR